MALKSHVSSGSGKGPYSGGGPRHGDGGGPRHGGGGPRHGDGGGPRHGGGSGGPPPPPKLPEPAVIRYFLDDQEEQPDPALMDAKAQEIGEALALQDALKPTQLRRYYDDVLNLRRRLEAECRQNDLDREAAFASLRADFKMLKAKAAYARGRDQAMFPERLLQFFIDHVHSADNARKFDVFCHHFQAVVAFHRFYKPKD